jgi:hypothetical protein
VAIGKGVWLIGIKMPNKLVILLVLLASIDLSIEALEERDTYRGAEKVQNATQRTTAGSKQQQQQNYKLSPTKQPNATSETLESAPTITSVHHQVWTSSSSGRLDELSPEVISKLRNDVPFLAAYALRPRLVGGGVGVPSSLAANLVDASGQQTLTGSERLASSSIATNINQPSGLGIPETHAASRIGPLEVGASSPLAARQSLVPKLGDFSELNVETSSLSKSEHHHKRKTSLKRPKSGKSDETNRRSISAAKQGRKPAATGKEDSLSQLVRRVKRKQTRGASRKRSSKRSGRGSRKGSNSKSRASRRNSGAGKRRGSSKRSRSNKRRDSRSRSARFVEEKPVETNDLDEEVRSTSTDPGKAAPANNEVADTKGGPSGSSDGDGEVKGGSSGTVRKPPFYAAGRKTTEKPKDNTESVERNLEDSSMGSKDSGASSGGGGAADADNGPANEADELDDEQQVEPKRVGDEDVDEDGDTVLVEPKFDGVDDDPPLPESADGDFGVGADDIADQGDGNNDDQDNKLDRVEPTSTANPLAPEGDPRGNRVNRQKPNVAGSADDERHTGDDAGDQSQVTGGGLGATFGGGGAGPAAGTGPGRDRETEDGNDKHDQAADEGDGAGDRDERFGGRQGADGGGKRKTGGGAQSGVEFADEADDERPRKDTEEEPVVGTDKPVAGADKEGRDTNSVDSSGDHEDRFGDRRQNDGPQQAGHSGGGQSSGSASSGSSGSSVGSGGRSSGRTDEPAPDEDEDLDYRDEMDRSNRVNPAAKDGGADAAKEHSGAGTNTGTGHPKADPHCDDGSYDHHGQHHEHSHHDTIEWLRDAIPGEPDNDYPILSRINATNFSCADQKHPGYYADVDARCQVSISGGRHAPRRQSRSTESDLDLQLA